MKIQIEKPMRSAAALLAAAGICVVYLRAQFISMREAAPLYPGNGVTEVRMLSEWYPGLKNTSGDTEVYILKGKTSGDKMLVLGGTHPNEPAGNVSAVLLIENVEMQSGTLYVIPRANSSAFTCTDPQEGSPMFFTVATPGGDRRFRFGSRATNPIDQWPDPEIYVQKSSGQRLSGSETRNLNRSYPGRTDGTFTEKISYGITELVRRERIAITVDLHEASPEYPTINAIVAHENAMLVASQALINMAIDGMDINLEPSPKNLHGLTHRELGDYTDTLAVLRETANPSQGRLRGRTDADLVVTGRDKFYVMAAGYGRLYVPFDENGYPLSKRVARHITGIGHLAAAYTELGLGTIVLGSIPSYDDLNAGIGAYLAPRNSKLRADRVDNE